jgi:hypothetical protein
MTRAMRTAALLLAAWALTSCAAGTTAPTAQDTARTITSSPTPANTAAAPTPPAPRPPDRTLPPGIPATGSGITGITLVDNCPVQRAETPCPGHPVTARLSIANAATGTVVTMVSSRTDGRFTVAVGPGRYVIRLIGFAAGPPHAQNPVTVTVTAGHYTAVTLHFDIGIR